MKRPRAGELPKGLSQMLGALNRFLAGQSGRSEARRALNASDRGEQQRREEDSSCGRRRKALAKAKARARFQRYWRKHKRTWRSRNRERMRIVRSKDCSALAA